jgi:ATP-binding cassette subfamily G (WHITE) protein 2 (SNQ2)
MVSTELQGRVVHCQASEFQIFNPPSGKSCFQYAESFLTMASGYLDNPDATDACRYCQYKNGESFFTGLNISFGERWRDLVRVAFSVSHTDTHRFAGRLYRVHRLQRHCYPRRQPLPQVLAPLRSDLRWRHHLH